MTRPATLTLLVLLLSGCLVPRAQYDEALEQSRGLSEQLERRELRLSELESRIRKLESQQQTGALEHDSLTEERLGLLAELEDLRVDHALLIDELAGERKTRRTRETEIEELSGTYRNLVEGLEEELESGKIEIHRLKGRLQVRALDQILFASGSAKITPQGDQVLAKLAKQLSSLEGHAIHVEGHTDSVPISTARFSSNWELSAARAANVVRALITHGVAAERLVASGYGPFRPIADQKTAKGRARNRRIEIVLVPDRTD